MAKFIVDCFNGYGMRLYNVSTRSTTCMLKFFLPAFCRNARSSDAMFEL